MILNRPIRSIPDGTPCTMLKINSIVSSMSEFEKIV
ncbi:unnamed protein product [Brassica rapa subsp. trilocularis]